MTYIQHYPAIGQWKELAVFLADCIWPVSAIGGGFFCKGILMAFLFCMWSGPVRLTWSAEKSWRRIGRRPPWGDWLWLLLCTGRWGCRASCFRRVKVVIKSADRTVWRWEKRNHMRILSSSQLNQLAFLLTAGETWLKCRLKSGKLLSLNTFPSARR